MITSSSGKILPEDVLLWLPAAKKEVKLMTLFEELNRRGLIAQTTDEKEIEELINTGKASTLLQTVCMSDTSWHSA